MKKHPTPCAEERICSTKFSTCVSLVLVSAFSFSQPGYAATSNYEVTPGSSIPDNACPSYTNTTINVPDNFTVTDLNVGLVVTHTYRNDLIVRLQSPAGTILELFSRVGNGDNNLNIMLDSDSSTNINAIAGNHSVTAPFYLNRFTPETASQLDGFDGENASGNWVLGICDDVGVDTGSIDQVMLSFEQSDFGDAPASYGVAQHTTSRLSEIEPIIIPNVDDSTVTVTTQNTYTKPVVVCTYALPSSTDNEAVVRVDDAESNSFDVRIQQPRNSTAVTAGDVFCLVAEEGQHTLPDGRVFEARTVTSTGTNNSASWGSGSMQDVSASITGTYANPAVLGQVMTENDSNFSVFWSSDCDSKNNPPFDTGMADGICVGKHVGEDSTTTRSNEILGYIVVEGGSGSFGGVAYEAALGVSSISGVGNSPPYSYTLSQTYDFAVASLSAMNGGNGGWASMYGAAPLAGGQIDLAIDEDTLNDIERIHIAEQVAYWAFTFADQPFIGTSPGDPETQTQSTAAADGDDSNDNNDEDGVIFRAPAGANHSIFADVVVNNPTGGTVTVCGWLDVPSTGGVTPAVGPFQTTDGSCQSTSAANPTLTFQWSSLPTDKVYTTYARFRISSGTLTTSNATGSAPDGEVEDYKLTFEFTPTAVTIGQVELRSTSLDDLLLEWNINSMNDAQLMGLLAKWDVDIPANADRSMLLSALNTYFDPDSDGRVAVLRWETLEERGTIGFYVERQEGDIDQPTPGHWERITDDMLPGLMFAPLGGEYILVDPEAQSGRIYNYRLVEQEARGSQRSYGPYRMEMQ